MNVAEEIKVASEDRLRADLYNFIGLMLSGPPDQLLINQCTGLSGDDGELDERGSKLTEPSSDCVSSFVIGNGPSLIIGLI